jgi:hypothetical protein
LSQYSKMLEASEEAEELDLPLNFSSGGRHTAQNRPRL